MYGPSLPIDGCPVWVDGWGNLGNGPSPAFFAKVAWLRRPKGLGLQVKSRRLRTIGKSHAKASGFDEGQEVKGFGEISTKARSKLGRILITWLYKPVFGR